MKNPHTLNFPRSPMIWAIILLLVTLLVAAFSPLEKTLGANARIVYLHGAWVWTALGRAGLLFLIASLPLSLYMMQANWNGLFMDEPRWRVPFTFAVAGLLLQVGLAMMRPIWASIANFIYGAALAIAMRGLVNILHPDSPIFTSGSIDIRVFFLVLLGLLFLVVWQVTRWFVRFESLAPAL